ncbi:MAG: PLP-dependent cysteine synthase family protein, partial [Dehalococcoidia bacterium]
MRYENILQAIGKTPMIRLEKFRADSGMNVFVKLEGNNPGGSIKDRAALYMIEQAERRGDLKKGKVILEATSGNMGISLAMIGAIKGYEVRIVMSSAMTEERKTMLRALGAGLILTDGKLGTRGAIERAMELFEESPGACWFADQFNNPDNIGAHYNGISSEILDEVADIDYLVAGTGTSGTIVGIAERFRDDSPETKIICVV